MQLVDTTESRLCDRYDLVLHLASPASEKRFEKFYQFGEVRAPRPVDTLLAYPPRLTGCPVVPLYHLYSSEHSATNTDSPTACYPLSPRASQGSNNSARFHTPPEAKLADLKSQQVSTVPRGRV